MTIRSRYEAAMHIVDTRKAVATPVVTSPSHPGETPAANDSVAAAFPSH
jgi:hypothetical protein